MSKKKKYEYKRYYMTKDGQVKSYNQVQKHIIAEGKDDLKHYINDTLKTANKKVKEINRIENILKTILRYRGYNKKNLNQRLYRLEHADEITIDDKKTLRKIMQRQKNIAGDLTDLLKFILELYDVHDTEIKQLKKQLEEYGKE